MTNSNIQQYEVKSQVLRNTSTGLILEQHVDMIDTIPFNVDQIIDCLKTCLPKSKFENKTIHDNLNRTVDVLSIDNTLNLELIEYDEKSDQSTGHVRISFDKSNVGIHGCYFSYGSSYRLPRTEKECMILSGLIWSLLGYDVNDSYKAFDLIYASKVFEYQKTYPNLISVIKNGVLFKYNFDSRLLFLHNDTSLIITCDAKDIFDYINEYFDKLSKLIDLRIFSIFDKFLLSIDSYHDHYNIKVVNDCFKLGTRISMPINKNNQILLYMNGLCHETDIDNLRSVYMRAINDEINKLEKLKL